MPEEKITTPPKDTLQIRETLVVKELPKEITWIRRVEDYYLIGEKKSDNSDITSIWIYSSDGTKISPRLRGNGFEIDAREKIRAAMPGPVSYIVGKNKAADRTGYVNISQLPEKLQKILLLYDKTLADHKEYHLDSLTSVYTWQSNSYLTEETCGGKYLVSPDKDNIFAVRVKNDAGIPLPPDQWKTYTLLNMEELPADLRKWYTEKEDTETYFSISTSLDAAVSSNGLIIFKAGDRSAVLFNEPSIADVTGNFVLKHGSPPILYFIPSKQPTEVKLIVLDDDPSKWVVLSAPFPVTNRYAQVKDLSIDSTGNFFVFQSGPNVNIVTIENLEQVVQMPNVLSPSFDSAGRLSVFSPPQKDGVRTAATSDSYTLKYYDIDFASFAQKQVAARQQQIAQGLNPTDLFKTADQKKAAQAAERAKALQPIIDTVLPAFEQQAASIRQSQDLDELKSLETGLDALKDKLNVQMVGQKENVNIVVDTIRLNVVEPLKRELYKKGATDLLSKVQADLQGSLSLASINFLNQDLRTLESMAPFLESSQRQEVVQLGREIQKKTSEYMAIHSEDFIHQADGIVKNAEQKLQGFTSKAEMDDWLEYEMPATLRNLGILYSQCPPEATAALTAIMKARDELSKLADTFENKFKREYAAIREKASEKTEEMARLITEDIQRLIERIKDKKFSNRKDAENYVSSSQTHSQIMADIDALKLSDPDQSKALHQQLEVQLSNLYYAIDRNSGKSVSDTGQQIVFFGETKVPIWEGKVKQRGERKVDVIFSEDKASHGPGVTPDKILGDIAVKIVDGEGKEILVRLFQELEDENERRYGFEEKMGEQIPPSYLTGESYRKFKKSLSDWDKGSERSDIQKEYLTRRKELRDLYATRPKRDQFSQDEQGNKDWKASREQWDLAHKTQYKSLLKVYAEYCRENNISLLRRIDQIKRQPDAEHVNGKGYIPEWQSHWVVDPQTEKYLEDMAQTLAMQSELQEGMLLLKGHAGTGKDVLVKMFCEQTRRPYFAIDCTKWTTEFELSEDIVLESVNGASETIKVPSVVLNAITTPGAVMYFNELNAMPEQAQIFLHSLLDEKRSLTLKTSSGKTVKAHPSVLIIGSMNPGYPGTFDPQFATRSRTVSINVDYPPLTRQPDKTDPNQKTKPISVSEALRVARGISSLQDMTYEMDLSRNEFVKMWDKYVNNIDTGAPAPTPEQKFDIETVLALVEFSNELREHFIATFENQKKTRSGDKVMEVKQPVTSREMRRCAYALSKMTPAEKSAKNPEDTARELLARFFLSHLDDAEARNKLESHIKTNMHSQKRMAP